MIRILFILLLFSVTPSIKADALDMRLVNISGTDELMSDYIGKG